MATDRKILYFTRPKQWPSFKSWLFYFDWPSRNPFRLHCFRLFGINIIF